MKKLLYKGSIIKALFVALCIVVIFSIPEEYLHVTNFSFFVGGLFGLFIGFYNLAKRKKDFHIIQIICICVFISIAFLLVLFIPEVQHISFQIEVFLKRMKEVEVFSLIIPVVVLLYLGYSIATHDEFNKNIHLIFCSIIMWYSLVHM